MYEAQEITPGKFETTINDLRDTMTAPAARPVFDLDGWTKRINECTDSELIMLELDSLRTDEGNEHRAEMAAIASKRLEALTEA